VEYQQILYDVAEGIATITMNRPEQLNANTNRMIREMIEAFNETDADDAVRAVIVTGAGKAFSAGADLSGGAETFAKGGSDERVDEVVRDGGGMLTLRIFDSLKPVIAAINGAAVGVGITMTLPMDIRLVSTTARMGFVFSRRGIVPEACSSWFLPRIVGISKAAEWCYSGRVFDAQEAVAAGLARSVHEPDELLDAARELAAEFTERTAPVSVALTRQMLWQMLTAPHPMDAHRVDSRGIQQRGRSADVREGVESFLAKRPPVFTDKVSSDLPDIFPDRTTRKFS
jgi:enoyl-CoA hydratase/carnithine racemase